MRFSRLGEHAAHQAIAWVSLLSLIRTPSPIIDRPSRAPVTPRSHPIHLQADVPRPRKQTHITQRQRNASMDFQTFVEIIAGTKEVGTKGPPVYWPCEWRKGSRA
ncbi:hypothetical protein SBBP2_570086 [Burkholderiales bacterium]|nr:hypothetical protein SBBP2_570086 [Burkholderiales bacterium]